MSRAEITHTLPPPAESIILPHRIYAMPSQADPERP